MTKLATYIKLANLLDELGYHDAARVVDGRLEKMAADRSDNIIHDLGVKETDPSVLLERAQSGAMLAHMYLKDLTPNNMTFDAIDNALSGAGQAEWSLKDLRDLLRDAEEHYRLPPSKKADLQVEMEKEVEEKEEDKDDKDAEEVEISKKKKLVLKFD